MVSVFTRKITDELTSLVKKIDKAVEKNEKKKMAAFVIYMNDDVEKSEGQLKAVAKKHKVKFTPLTIFDEEGGPGAYKLGKDAEVTVVMWSGQEIQATHAFAKGKLNKKTIKKVLRDASKMLKDVKEE